MTETFPLTITKPGALVVLDRRLEELLAINLLDDESPRPTTARRGRAAPQAAHRRDLEVLVATG